ncbi:MAG: zinc-ribbon domain-containing protein [Candidatus Magasanikbacteria bacterium]|nr:zinc-ribbon domain-containing protein [Candidatus Magasanikbacteria bacterium]
MNCIHCGNRLPSDAKFCNKCGKPIESVKEINAEHVEYFSISLLRLAVLSVLTLGIYDVYWFYKNWDAIKKQEGKKISPLARAIFAVFYCHDLFKRVALSAKNHGYVKKISYSFWATTYIILIIAGTAMGQVARDNPDFKSLASDYPSLVIYFSVFQFIIILSSFIPLLPIQKVINFNNDSIAQIHQRKKFSIGEAILIVLGIVFFGSIILSTYSSLARFNTNNIVQVHSKKDFINKSVASVKTNLNLPYRVDEATTLVNITAESNAIRYHYVISGIDTSDFSNAYLKDYLRPTVCQNKDIKNILDQDINIEHSYFVEDTRENYFISFAKADCLQYKL